MEDASDNSFSLSYAVLIVKFLCDFSQRWILAACSQRFIWRSKCLAL